MGRKWNPDAIPDSSFTLFDGVFEFEIENIEETLTKGADGGPQKVMYNANLRCVGPDLIDSPHVERFVLGTDEDPMWEDPATPPTIAATALKRLLKKAGVELTPDLDDDCSRAAGQHVILMMKPELQRTGAYAGQRMQNRVTGTYALGEKELDGAPAPAAPPAPAQRPAAPKPQAPVRPAAPAPRSALAARPAAPAPQSRPAAPAKATKEQMLGCAICNQQVPKSQYVTHVAQHEAGDE